MGIAQAVPNALILQKEGELFSLSTQSICKLVTPGASTSIISALNFRMMLRKSYKLRSMTMICFTKKPRKAFRTCQNQQTSQRINTFKRQLKELRRFHLNKRKERILFTTLTKVSWCRIKMATSASLIKPLTNRDSEMWQISQARCLLQNRQSWDQFKSNLSAQAAINTILAEKGLSIILLDHLNITWS